MFENRNLKFDLFALALLAVVCFLGVSLVTYDRADPPGTLIYPATAEISNACGQWGAWVADRMLTGLGLGAYYTVISLALFDGLLLMRREIGEPLLRVVGWVVSLVAITALVAMALPDVSLGPVIGPGGYLGAAGRGMLEAHFATAGAYILSASLLLGGLLLCTDYVLVRISMWLIGVPAKGLVRAGKVAVGRQGRPPKVSKKSDEADEEEWEYEDEEEEEENEVPIKISGRPVLAEENEEEEEEAEGDEDEEFDEEEADEAPVETKKKRGKRKKKKHRLAAGLKIRPPVRKKSDRDEIIEKLDAATLPGDSDDYVLPPVELLLDGDDFAFDDHERQVRRTAKLLERTFENFGFNVKVVEIQTGPVIAQYEIELERGLRLAKITNLGDDIAIALRVPSVRIVAPIPGKNTVGIEVPNEQRQMVRIREIIEEADDEQTAKMKIPIFLGKDVSGNPMVIDLASLPHLLIAGRTGTGKSVCLNSLIISMLMTRRPDEVRMLMIDPKMVELSPYQRLPHLMHPVVTDMGKAAAILEWAVNKMEERYALLARAGVRHVSVYNQLGEEELKDRLQPESDEEWAEIPRHLPYIVIVADEIADLMMTAGKEVEQHIIRLAQKSRAIGIHLILATQKPTVDVITGLIKSNLPARISFQVASRTDSRVVLDEMGAEKLLGNGDMLFLWPGTSTLHRGQGTFVTDDEINDVIGVVGTNKPQFVEELVQLQPKNQEDGDGPGQLKKRDELYEGAVDVIVREGRGSVSLLQRSLGVGYGRAARLIDFMAEDGIVGPYNGSQARDVLISVEQWAQMMGDAEPEPTSPVRAAKPKALPSPSSKRKTTVVKPDDEDAPWEDDEDEVIDEEPIEEEVEEEEYEEEDASEGEEYEYEEEDASEDEEYEEEYEYEEEEEEEEEEVSADRNDDAYQAESA